MNAAATTKVMAKRAAKMPSQEVRAGQHLNLCRFLLNLNEKKFVTAFANGIEQRVTDISHYVNVWRSTRLLQRADRISMQNVLGTEIDLKNILWVYRLKKYYQINSDTAYSFLIPISHRLPSTKLAKIVACNGIADMRAVLASTIYNNVFGNFSDPEECVAQAVREKYRIEGRRSHIALVCGYLL